MTLVRLKPVAPRSRVEHSTTKPLRSLKILYTCVGNLPVKSGNCGLRAFKLHLISSARLWLPRASSASSVKFLCSSQESVAFKYIFPEKYNKLFASKLSNVIEWSFFYHSFVKMTSFTYHTVFHMSLKHSVIKGLCILKMLDEFIE